MSTPLTMRIAAQIVAHIRDEDLATGTRLVERTLADRLRVSRSPVRNALRMLADDGIVSQGDGGGFHVARTGAELPAPPDTEDGLEAAYLRIAEDRLDGALPDRVTETALARQYGLTGTQVGRILTRIDKEGWGQRAPGYGWEFRPMLDTVTGYRDSYRFRLAIEPAALLEPGFVLNRATVEAARAQQQRLVDGEVWTVPKTTLFDLNSKFHETLICCSNNEFFIDGLARLNAVRRLIEYRRTLSRDRAIVRCREHVALADVVLAGDLAAAAELLRTHLDTVGREKTAPASDRSE
jgi:DNA-binding GntR family transcriptional regulator